MPSRCVNPYLVKLNRSYTASELAALLKSHKNTAPMAARGIVATR